MASFYQTCGLESRDQSVSSWQNRCLVFVFLVSLMRCFLDVAYRLLFCACTFVACTIKDQSINQSTSIFKRCVYVSRLLGVKDLGFDFHTQMTQLSIRILVLVLDYRKWSTISIRISRTSGSTKNEYGRSASCLTLALMQMEERVWYSPNDWVDSLMYEG